jgi:hypothetical protein
VFVGLKTGYSEVDCVRWVPEAGWEVLKWVGRILRGVPHATVVVVTWLFYGILWVIVYVPRNCLCSMKAVEDFGRHGRVVEESGKKDC